MQNCIRVLKKINSPLSDTDTVAWLRDHLGNTVNCRDRAGHSPLTMAGSQGKEDTVFYLISMGAVMDYCQPNGFNTFSSALYNGHFELAKRLFCTHNDIFSLDSGVQALVDPLTLKVFTDMLTVELFGEM
jgi:ankyrin repeat protein